MEEEEGVPEEAEGVGAAVPAAPAARAASTTVMTWRLPTWRPQPSSTCLHAAEKGHIAWGGSHRTSAHRYDGYLPQTGSPTTVRYICMNTLSRKNALDQVLILIMKVRSSDYLMYSMSAAVDGSLFTVPLRKKEYTDR